MKALFIKVLQNSVKCYVRCIRRVLSFDLLYICTQPYLSLMCLCGACLSCLYFCKCTHVSISHDTIFVCCMNGAGSQQKQLCKAFIGCYVKSNFCMCQSCLRCTKLIWKLQYVAWESQHFLLKLNKQIPKNS